MLVMDSKVPLGEGLRSRRLELGLSVNQLAALTGLSRQTIMNLEKGVTKEGNNKTIRALRTHLSLPEGWPDEEAPKEGDAQHLKSYLRSVGTSEQEADELIELYQRWPMKNRQEFLEYLKRGVRNYGRWLSSWDPQTGPNDK
jgi:transcriptional regulator with XRE-family HTH domain